MPKPLTPLVVRKFAGEQDQLPGVEVMKRDPITGTDTGEHAGFLVKNFYLVKRGLERRLGQYPISSSLGTSKMLQGLQWFRTDPDWGTSAAIVPPSDPLTDPLTLANLQLYLRGDQAGGSNNSAVTTWVDLSGNGRTGTPPTSFGATEPINRDATSLNGLRRVVEFNGIQDAVKGILPSGVGIPNTNGYTVYSYINETALTTPGNNIQEIFAAIGGFELISKNSTGGYSIRGTVFNDVGVTVTGWQTVTGVWNTPVASTGALRLYYNGTQVGGDVTNWSGTIIDNYYIGNNAVFTIGFKGYVGALLFFSEAHNDTTRRGVERYLVDYFEG